MFNIGFPELLVIFGVALLAFGPDKLPELARQFGKFSAQLKRQTDSLRREFYNEVYKPVDEGTKAVRNATSDLSGDLLNLTQKDNTCEPVKATSPLTVPVDTESKETKQEEPKVKPVQQDPDNRPSSEKKDEI